jgi:hypothetical protein
MVTGRPGCAVMSVGNLWGRPLDADLWDFCGGVWKGLAGWVGPVSGWRQPQIRNQDCPWLRHGPTAWIPVDWHFTLVCGISVRDESDQ